MSDSAAKALPARPAHGGQGKFSDIARRISRYRGLYLILLPGIVFFAVFAYGPMYGIVMAFKSFNMKLGILGSPWIEPIYENFRLIFINPEFKAAFGNTLIISLMKTIIGFPVPIILAIVINEVSSKRFSRTVQTIYTFPHFLSWVILAGIVSNLLSTDGVINNFLTLTGGKPANFLMNAGAFRWLLVVTDIWKESGWSTIMYLATIASIDPSQYESATIDGASRWQKAAYITLPGMSMMVVILLTLAVGNSMNSNFDQIFNLYNPATFSTGDVLDTYIYRLLSKSALGYSFMTAVGLFKGVINFALLMGANQITKRISGTGRSVFY
ncbi:MAG: ABC transporter permease subunit [Clostridiales bacterium]|jgi:putative aldouronate transport system permease protein|nr:ABC transporter permease subunit [Clostridiales bacterium]